MSHRGRAKKFPNSLVREVVTMTNMGFSRRDIAAELNLLYDQVMYIQRKQNATRSVAKPWTLWSEEYKLAACLPWRSACRSTETLS
jgi:orotate phosphoribosyltransferase-like protein